MSASAIYAASSEGPLRQGEILSQVVQLKLAISGLSSYPSEPALPTVRNVHPLAIVVSQDCDLDQDFAYRSQGRQGKEITSIFLCEVNLATEIRGLPEMMSKIWDRIKINKDERYQFLEKVPSDCDSLQHGLPEMAVDFKRCFSIPTPELYLQLNGQATRRCRLICPYSEHFSQRLFHFHSRIGLPEDHRSEPEAK